MKRESMTIEQYRALPKAKPSNREHNVRCQIEIEATDKDGKPCRELVWFDSKEEAVWYKNLELRRRNGEIRNLKRQVKFELSEGVSITIDATYEELWYSWRDHSDKWWEHIIADYKGTRLTKKLKQPVPRMAEEFRIKWAWLKQVLEGGAHKYKFVIATREGDK